jgi:hypothetical protein
MRLKEPLEILSTLLYEFLDSREMRKIEAKILEEEGILPDFGEFEENVKEDFPNIKEIIEKFVSRKVRVHLEVNEDVEHLEAYITHRIQIPMLQEYYLKIKEMFDSSSVDTKILEEMIEVNLPWTVFVISDLIFAARCTGEYFPSDDLISLNFSSIREASCLYLELGYPVSRLKREERAFEKVVLGEEIAHSLGKNLLSQLYDLRKLMYFQTYELGKNATEFLRGNPTHMKGYSEETASLLPRILFPTDGTVFPLAPWFAKEMKKSKEWSKLEELLEKTEHLAVLSEGLAKFIVKVALVENNPEFKDLYLFKEMFPSPSSSIYASLKFFEECYKQVGNSIFERVTLSPPTPEEISNPSLYLQRVRKIA